ncbi:MAG: DM13 domain-containing protein [Armatimonadota bacterium]|nr:DM13 domain-containing protein [Armatimonadota bacterium]
MRTPTRTGRNRPWVWFVVLGAIVVLPIAWYLGSPLFLDKTVNEVFPMSTNATLPAGVTREQAEQEMREASKQAVTAADGMPAAAPTPLAAGAFGDVDAVHTGTGTATIYRIGGGLVLRLDPFRVTNGPDLYVYLSGHPAPRNSQQLHEGAALEVSRLKGNIGAQNYTLPADIDLSIYRSVVVYCRRFSVVFSTAELKAR